jgi:hypothetical protein
VLRIPWLGCYRGVECVPLVLLVLQGLVTDAKQVAFFTNATAYEDWPSGGLLGNGTGQ